MIIYMYCPLCGKNHSVEERKCIASIVIRGEEVEYEEHFLFCSNTNKEFETGIMVDENFANARNAYRIKKGLPPS